MLEVIGRRFYRRRCCLQNGCINIPVDWKWLVVVVLLLLLLILVMLGEVGKRCPKMKAVDSRKSLTLPDGA